MKKIIVGALALITVCALFVGYGRYVKQQTIESAALVDDNGSEYVISFDGEDHIYSR